LGLFDYVPQFCVALTAWLGVDATMAAFGFDVRQLSRLYHVHYGFIA
jgi:hypothetical protein